MSIAPQLITLPSDAAAIDSSAHVHPSRSDAARIHAPQPDAAISTPEQNPPSPLSPTSMPSPEQLTQLRYAAMGEGIRRLLGGPLKSN